MALAGIGCAVLTFSLTGCSGELNALAQNEEVRQEVLEKLGEVEALQGVMPEIESIADALPNNNADLPETSEQAGQASDFTGRQQRQMPQFPEGQQGQMPGFPGGEQGQMPQLPEGQQGQMPQFPEGQQGQMPQFSEGQQGQMPTFSGSGTAFTASPSEIAEGTAENSAMSLTVNEEAAETILMNESNNQVKIETAGTYLISGSCSSGNITVKKGTEGVVLILKDLDLTSTTGAALSCNKGSEVKIVVEGTVKLTDAEDPADEDSADAETADAFDGAAIKIKDGAQAVLTGSGTLVIDASSCKNGIKVGNEDAPSLVIDGGLTIRINAANDGINSGYDLTILSGTLEISAGDDAIHADRILTVGSTDGTGPTLTVTRCGEALEGTVVNLFGGTGSLNASDDAVNAANKDGTFSDELTFSVNITGGSWEIGSSGDGIDSNGNINITGGSVTIRSASGGGEAGLDYLGSLYVADGTLTNYSGISFDSGQGGMPGSAPGRGRMPGGTSGQSQMPADTSGQP